MVLNNFPLIAVSVRTYVELKAEGPTHVSESWKISVSGTFYIQTIR